MDNVVSLKDQEVDRGTVASDPSKTSRLSPRPAVNPLGSSRRVFDNRFVYAVVSQRARGLSIGVNLNPDMNCTFDCIYCEVSRTEAPRAGELDLKGVAAELRRMLALAAEGRVHELPGYQTVPQELLNLK